MKDKLQFPFKRKGGNYLELLEDLGKDTMLGVKTVRATTKNTTIYFDDDGYTIQDARKLARAIHDTYSDVTATADFGRNPYGEEVPFVFVDKVYSFMRESKMKKLNITKEAYEKSRYFKNKYGKLEYVSESGKVFKTDKGKVLMFKENEDAHYADDLTCPNCKSHEVFTDDGGKYATCGDCDYSWEVKDYTTNKDDDGYYESSKKFGKKFKESFNKDDYDNLPKKYRPKFDIGDEVSLTEDFYDEAEMGEPPEFGWTVEDVRVTDATDGATGDDIYLFEYYIVPSDIGYDDDEDDEYDDEDDSTGFWVYTSWIKKAGPSKRMGRRFRESTRRRMLARRFR